MGLGRSIAVLLCLAGAASAVDHPEEARKLNIKDAAGRRSLSWAASLPPPVTPAAQPTIVGATLTVTGAGGETASFDLPASGWTADQTGTSFRFTNPLAPAGPSPVKRASFKSFRIIKVAAKASGITLDEATQGTVSVSLAIGGDVYCSRCTAARRDQVGRYAAVQCQAPADCSQLTTTSTSTTTTATASSTTSSSMPPVCGNGVVEGSEQCDLPDPGECASIPFPMPVGCAACQCCAVSQCFIGFSPYAIGCCAGACQDVSGAGFVRSGVCVPPSCAQDADCNGYTCDGGTCCGQAGALCGVVGCCAGSGATCSTVGWVGSPVCCRAASASCAAFDECCSGSCTAGVCD